jgi:hypothetical protein
VLPAAPNQILPNQVREELALPRRYNTQGKTWEVLIQDKWTPADLGPPPPSATAPPSDRASEQAMNSLPPKVPPIIPTSQAIQLLKPLELSVPAELVAAIKALITATPNSSPQYEMETAGRDLVANVSDIDKPYVRYLSYYAVPSLYRDRAEKTLNFWLNSLSREPDITRQVRVGKRDSRLTRIDIRDYRFDPVFWEKLAVKDPFFLEPWIDHEIAGYLREVTNANIVLRADWFLFMTSDTTEDTGYYDLLYGKDTPKTVGEFANVWGVDFERAVKQFQNDLGASVDEGNSLVSLHNRTLWRLRTVLGSYWGTFDVLESAGERDMAEHIFPGEEGSKFDAQEHIASMPNGLQAYLLSDGVQKRVEFGDPAVVRDSTDPHGDVRVRTSASCVRCHVQGMNRPKSMLPDYEEAGVSLVANDPRLARRIEYFFYTDLEPLLQEDNARYATAVKACNDLTPEENAAAFTQLLAWYEGPVTLEQAAIECGVTVDRLVSVIKASPRVRMQRLAAEGQVPRKAWDKQLFAQSMLLLDALQKK